MMHKKKILLSILGGLALSVGVASPPTNPNTPGGTFLKPTMVTASSPLVIDNKSDIVISNVQISNPNGHCITIRNSTNITIKDSVIGPCGESGIQISDSRAVQVVGNYIERTVKAIGAVRSTEIVIDFNYGKNNVGPFPHGQFVQFDNVYGRGNKIRCNASDVDLFNPNTTFSTPLIRTEDQISIYMSSGLPSDNLTIEYNRLRGGGSRSGSGIMVGDYGGSYTTVRGNRVVNPWNTGISNAGGHDNTIEYNKIYSNLPSHIANEGMYVRNFTPGASACYNINHRYNQITWPPDDWSTEGWTQKYWDSNECTNIVGTQTNNLNSTLTAAIFTEPIAECRTLAQQRGYSPTGW